MYSVTTHSYSKIFNTKINKSSGRQKYLPVPHSVMHNVLRKPVRAYFPHQCNKIRYIWLRYTHLGGNVGGGGGASPLNREQCEHISWLLSFEQWTKWTHFRSYSQQLLQTVHLQVSVNQNCMLERVLMQPCAMQHATLYNAACDPVQCSMRPCTMQHATPYNTVRDPVLCSMQPCPMQCATLYNALCNPVQCSMQPYTMQYATLYICNPVQCSTHLVKTSQTGSDTGNEGAKGQGWFLIHWWSAEAQVDQRLVLTHVHALKMFIMIITKYVHNGLIDALSVSRIHLNPKTIFYILTQRQYFTY